MVTQQEKKMLLDTQNTTCGNCKFGGEKVYTGTSPLSLHCEHPKENGNSDPWGTLCESDWDACPDYERRS